MRWELPWKCNIVHLSHLHIEHGVSSHLAHEQELPGTAHGANALVVLVQGLANGGFQNLKMEKRGTKAKFKQNVYLKALHI